MVARRALALGLLSLGCSRRVAPPASVLLRGFRLVDVASRSVRQRDLVVHGGTVVPATGQSVGAVIEGAGRFLMPALWDVRASLWGNDAAFDYDVLAQEMNLTTSLRVQLYYGVAHVAAFGMAGDWAAREVRRAEALEMVAAEVLFPDRALGGANSFASSAVIDERSLERELQSRRALGAPFVQLIYGAQQPLPSLSRPLLESALRRTAQLGLPAMVLVDDWQRAAEAVRGGARLLYGFPEGLVPSLLVAEMKSLGVAFAPALTRFLELDGFLGHGARLADPFLGVSVMPEVLASFRDPAQLWVEWRGLLERGRSQKQTMLDSVRALSQAGVAVLSASDAGWVAGTFQGYSSHAAQSWLERAGVTPWNRLAAATVAAAAAFGRRNIGFAPGHAADFLALDADPLESAEHLRRISFVMRAGKVVDRQALLPDLTRSKFKP